jgi:hypothetical protein
MDLILCYRIDSLDKEQEISHLQLMVQSVSPAKKGRGFSIHLSIFRACIEEGTQTNPVEILLTILMKDQAIPKSTETLEQEMKIGIEILLLMR